MELAEDSAQEAFLRAHALMASGEPIKNLGAWATTSARRIAIDSLRRDTVLRSKLPLLLPEDAPQPDDAAAHNMATSRLELILIACHPVLSEEQQIALALRIVCGIPIVEESMWPQGMRSPRRWMVNPMPRS